MSHPFQIVSSVEPMVSSPGDFALVRRNFCFWQSRHRAHGTIMWGRATEEDVVEACQIWDAHLRSPHGAEPTLTDVRAFEWMDLLAFDRLVRTFIERRADWTALAGPQAILHRGGYGAAVILGALQVAGQGYRIGSFDAQPAALGWLGKRMLAEDYGRLRASLVAEPELVRRVRATLDERDAPLAPEQVARRVGLSLRSLQRHLASAGTSLREERRRHVVSRAEKLLIGTDLDLGAIAAMLGVESPSRLISMFRAEHKLTPGEFRRSAKRPHTP